MRGGCGYCEVVVATATCRALREVVVATTRNQLCYLATCRALREVVVATVTLVHHDSIVATTTSHMSCIGVWGHRHWFLSGSF